MGGNVEIEEEDDKEEQGRGSGMQAIKILFRYSYNVYKFPNK